MNMNKKSLVYLAGPMEGLSANEMTGWRLQMADYLTFDGIACLDPCRRKVFHGSEDLNLARMLFRCDLRDIDNSDYLFADVRRDKGRAAGTHMEIMYAWTKDKPIILWQDPTDPPHPFYMSVATVIVQDMILGANAIRLMDKADTRI